MTFNNRIRVLKDKIPHPTALCGFAGQVEAEVMVAQTIHACVCNLDDNGKAYSYKSKNLRSVQGGGLVDNPRGLQILKERGWVKEERINVPKPIGQDIERDGLFHIVLVPTQRLILDLETHFSK